ncbi:MAG: hypothetical protein A2Y25_05720 [Candidatus Melainabacteria bacterium GWF2_37_15]|nr:MAG: hypothetical protein A2Y25_05720 [Candidatus Melainabacteria bacterium GWF2_37_15]
MSINPPVAIAIMPDRSESQKILPAPCLNALKNIIAPAIIRNIPASTARLTVVTWGSTIASIPSAISKMPSM